MYKRQAFQNGSRLGGTFIVVATARPGKTLDELLAVIDQEVQRVKAEGVTGRELQRFVNQTEASFLGNLERVGGFSGKADQLNHYLYFTGTPDYFEADLNRFRSLSARDVQDAAMTFLRPDARIVLSMIPTGQAALAASGSVPAVNKF